jgi:phosphate transport system protein
LLAHQAPVAGNLRIVVALLHIARCIERMGDQCVNIAKLIPLCRDGPPKDIEILDTFERIDGLTRSLIYEAK